MHRIFIHTQHSNSSKWQQQQKAEIYRLISSQYVPTNIEAPNEVFRLVTYQGRRITIIFFFELREQIFFLLLN